MVPGKLKKRVGRAHSIFDHRRAWLLVLTPESPDLDLVQLLAAVAMAGSGNERVSLKSLLFL